MSMGCGRASDTDTGTPSGRAPGALRADSTMASVSSACAGSTSHSCTLTRPGWGCVAMALCTLALAVMARRSEEHTSELQSPDHLLCRLLLEIKNVVYDMFY